MLCSLDLAPVDRAVEILLSVSRFWSTGGTTVKNLTIGGRPAGRPTAGNPAELDPNGYIFEAYKMGLF